MASDSIVIKIPGKPKARQAHQMANGHKFLPKESMEFQSWVRLCASQAMAGREPINTLVHIDYLFVFPAPMSALRAAERKRVIDGELLLWPIRADFDNLAKSVNDGIKGFAISDDHLIADFSGVKRIGREPMTVVTITPIHAAE